MEPDVLGTNMFTPWNKYVHPVEPDVQAKDMLTPLMKKTLFTDKEKWNRGALSQWPLLLDCVASPVCFWWEDGKHVTLVMCSSSLYLPFFLSCWVVCKCCVFDMLSVLFEFLCFLAFCEAERHLFVGWCPVSSHMNWSFGCRSVKIVPIKQVNWKKRSTKESNSTNSMLNT